MSQVKVGKFSELEFSVSGDLALFTTPDSKMGGEKFSYDIPTYEAVKGILKSIYWKPTFIWVVDKVRVMKKIQRTAIKTSNIVYNTGTNKDLFTYTYLKNVEYQVKAHFEWNKFQATLQQDRILEKHFSIAHRMLERGGKRPIVLGTTECQAFVRSCKFGEGVSHYDNIGEISYPNVFHGYDWPDESVDMKAVYKRFWTPIMKDGVVEFVRPEECKTKVFIRDMEPKHFGKAVK